MQAYLELLTQIGLNLKNLRQAQNLSQEDLSSQASITREYLSKLENAKLPNVSLKVLYNLCEILGVELGNLLKSKSENR